MNLTHLVIYVSDVIKTVEFYEIAFGFKRRLIHESSQYAELESGETKLAFVSHTFMESILDGKDYIRSDLKNAPLGFQISFDVEDVTESFDKAINSGCTLISKPEMKPWGCEVAYVRDINGVLVELCQKIV